jgi:NADPH-dependent 2,4-dienoyl-CoA reductase/sulfur reductase-like enzyme
MMKRRALLQGLGGGSAAVLAGGLTGCATVGQNAQAKVVVIGGGYAGATAAKYLRLWSNGGVDVTMVEPNPAFYSCPLSNLVVAGMRGMKDITTPYDNLTKRHGVKVVQDMVVAVDTDKRKVKLAGGAELPYDRLVVSPGIDFMYEQLPGLSSVLDQNRVVHAWKAGGQTVTLAKQLQAMPDGGVFAIAVPPSPYRCPPGPYERASLVADYFKKNKPRSKVLILDPHKDVVAKGKLFKAAWAEKYQGILEHMPNHKLEDVDVASGTLKFEFSPDVKADVLNVIPAMKAGGIARGMGLANVNNRWCDVDFLTYESKVIPNVHVLGDSIAATPGMPKSGFMANQHAKTCAAAIVAMTQGQAVPNHPIFANTCYSFVDAEEACHVSAVYAYDEGKKQMVKVKESGGLSAGSDRVGAAYAQAWADNIWADMLA